MRNKIKRQLRSIIDNVVDVDQECDIFIVAKTNILSLDFEEKKNDIKQLFKLLNIKEIINGIN